MNLENNKNKTTPLVLVILLVLFAFIFGGGTVVANAEAVAETTSVQEVIDNSIFVTFRKGDNESRGKYMVACYFVPMEYYDSSYTYGAVIFPKDYGIKPTGNPSAKYTDPKNKNKEYVLTDEQKDKFKEIYQEQYAQTFAKVIGSSKYKIASDEKKAILLENARDDVLEDTKDEFFKWLKNTGAKSTAKKK